MINIKKIQEAILDMMSKVSVDKKHNYTRKSDGKWLAGVSSVAGIFPKDFLAPWAAKEAVKSLGYEDEELAKETIEKIKSLSVKKFQELLHKAKTAYKDKSDTAKLDGTKGHEYLHYYILAKMRKTELPKLIDKNLERPINQFIEWADKNIKQWILSEARVCSIKEEIAGQLDGLAITTADKLAIIDFKFANQVSDDYHLQTAGYSIPFEKYGIKIEDRIIIRLPKTLTKKVYNRKTRQYDEVENKIEIARSPFSMEFDCETFRNARIFYRYINACKKRSINK